MPQPNYSDGGWETSHRLAYQPDEVLIGCSCPKILGQRVVQPTCGIHGTRGNDDYRTRLRFR